MGRRGACRYQEDTQQQEQEIWQQEWQGFREFAEWTKQQPEQDKYKQTAELSDQGKADSHTEKGH